MQLESQNNLISLQKACHQFKGLVFASPAITKNLLKFELTPAEFLRPFFQLSNKVKLRLGQREKMVENFSVTLLDIQEYQASTREILDRQAKEIIQEHAPPIDILEVTSKWNHKPSVDQMVDSNMTPWLHQNQQTVADFSSHAYHLNFLDQPIVLVYVISGQEPDIVKEIERIRQEYDKFLKAVFAINPSDIDQIKKYIIILNDTQEKIQFNQEEKIRKEFQNHMCKVMPYNLAGSIPLNIWIKTYRRRLFIQGSQSKQAIRIIDETTLKSYRDQFEQFLSFQVLPKLENTINVMTQMNIEARRKPISDAFFNLFQGREQSKPEVHYLMSQREFYLRYLGDMNFLLQEYDNSAEYYKTLLSELKNNKTRTTLANLNALEYLTYSRLCHEQGVTAKHQRKERDEIFSAFEEISAGYIQEKQTAFILSQYMQFKIKYQKDQRFIKESILILQKTNKYLRDMGSLQKPDNFMLFSTMIFEQIAYMYLRLECPQYRKFAHNLTLVASRYEMEGYKRNSLRCYRIVEAVYRESQWIGILTWLQCHLGANYLDCEKITEGIDSFKQAFNFTNDRQNIDSHNQLVTDWKKAQTALQNPRYQKEIQSKAIAQTRYELKYPILKGPVDIINEDDRIYQLQKLNFDKFSPDIPTIQNPPLKGKNDKKPNQFWISLKQQGCNNYEETLLTSMDSQYLEDKISCFNRGILINTSKLTDLQDKYHQHGRQTFVNDHIILRIRMQSQLKVASGINNLKVVYDFYTNEQQQNDSVDLLQMDEIKTQSKSNIIQSTLAPQESVSYSFQRPQTEIIEVCLIPNKSGILTIRGLSWDFFDIPASHNLNYDFKDQSKRRTINFFNKFYVLPQAPILQISLISSLDPEIFYGEVRPVKLCLKNSGNDAIFSIELIPLESHHFGFRRILLDEPLQPQSSREYQIYIRCSLMENFTAKLLFRYKVGENIYRYARMIFPMQVNSSFKITQQHDQNIDNWRFTLIVQEYFKGLMNQSSCLNFTKILCLNELWKPSDLNQTIIQQSHEEQFMFVTFSLKKLKEKNEINKEIFQKKVDCFIDSPNMISQIDLGGISQQINLLDETLQNFINQDIRYYFNSFYNFDKNDTTFEFPLFLVLQWTLDHPEIQRQITGMHEIPFTSNHFLLSKKNLGSNQEFPLSIQIDVQQEFQHNFDKKPFLQVPVRIKVKNSKFHYKVSFRMEFVNGDETLKVIQDASEPAFQWLGITNTNLQLEPQEIKIIDQSLLFMQNGFYDVSRIRISLFQEFEGQIKKHEKQQTYYYSSDYEQIFVLVNQ